ncbi:MAG: hypothetical protein RBQ78_07340 [Acholeplasmataceae bacterium]|jgi:hypothetical protein|nr:hypothetical protein [Acholeplasmataceae bacterium]
MGFLFKLFILPILLLIGIPLALVGAMYKSVDIPVDEFTSGTGQVNFEEMVVEEIDAFLLDATPTSTFDLEINQETVNQLLLTQFQEMNPNYLVDTATDDEKNYVLKEEMYAYQGSWVRFKEGNVVEIESGLHAFVGGFTFKTRLLLSFILEIDTEEIFLTLDKVTIGNVPLAWAMTAASWIAERVTGQNLEELISEQIEGIGTFDPIERKVTVEVDALLNSFLDENDENKPLIDALLQFIGENELIDIGFDDEVFAAEIALGKIIDETEPVVLANEDKIIDDAHMQTILTSKASTVILSSVTGEDPYIKLDDFTLNRVFEYFMRPNLTVNGYVTEVDLMENYKAYIYVPYVTMEEDMIVNIPLQIVDINDPSKVLPSIIKIHAIPEIIGSDLLFHLKGLDAGELSLSEEHIGLILDVLGENELIEGDSIIIRDFDQMMDSTGINIVGSEIKNLHLYLYIQLNLFEDLGNVEELATAALELVQGNPDLPPELADSIQAVIDNIDNPEVIDELINEMVGEMIETSITLITESENIPEELSTALIEVTESIDDPEALDEAITEVMTVIEGMDEAEQEALFTELTAALGDTGMSYEDLLGLLP